MIVRPAQPIATQNKVSSDRRAIFVSLSNESGEVDLLLAQRNQRFGQLRTIYIDTSAQDDTGNGCVIETDIGQNITVLANTQGYYTVFVPFVSVIKVSSNQSANLLLLDFDAQPQTWNTNASEPVPDPLHVIIDNQPIATEAAQSGEWNVNFYTPRLGASASLSAAVTAINYGPQTTNKTLLVHVYAFAQNFSCPPSNIFIRDGNAGVITGVSLVLPDALTNFSGQFFDYDCFETIPLSVNPISLAITNPPTSGFITVGIGVF